MGAILSATDYSGQMGWKVFPLHSVRSGKCTCRRCQCPSPGKHPRTRNGLKDATTDGRIIKKWQRQSPESNIGILTGSESGIVVVDVDAGKGGFESLARLVKAYGLTVLDTLTVDTGGGGLHLLYLDPDLHIKNSQGALDVGIDVRGDGGYIVGAPSNHVSGKKYVWRDGIYQPERIPDALLGAILSSQQKDNSGKINLPTVIQTGKRNDAIFRYAASLRGYGKNLEAIREAISRVNSERCVTPLCEDELIRIANSATTYAKSNHGLLNLYRQEIANAGELLKSSTRLVLHTLLIHADQKTLIAFPSQETLAKESGLSDQSVRNHTEIAKNCGWLEISKKARINGQPGSQCFYRLTFPERVNYLW